LVTLFAFADCHLEGSSQSYSESNPKSEIVCGNANGDTDGDTDANA